MDTTSSSHAETASICSAQSSISAAWFIISIVVNLCLKGKGIVDLKQALNKMRLRSGTVLAALLLGDGVFARIGWKGQLTAGLIGGGVTVFCRLRYGADGAAVGVLLACVATTILLFGYRFLRPRLLPFVQKFAKTKN
mgnify:CR=1 FL=1